MHIDHIKMYINPSNSVFLFFKWTFIYMMIMDNNSNNNGYFMIFISWRKMVCMWGYNGIASGENNSNRIY